MKLKLIPLLLACLLLPIHHTCGEIPGFIEKWRLNLGSTNTAEVEAIGRDGATFILVDPRRSWDFSQRYYIWASSSGDIIARLPELYFVEDGEIDPSRPIPVMVNSSNLIVQAHSFGHGLDVSMQITQVVRNGQALQTTKTTFLAKEMYDSRTLQRISHDFSCQERLMFVQQQDVLFCYRPVADMPTSLTSLNMIRVSGGTAELAITSSQGGQLELQESSNLSEWRSITNVHVESGVTPLKVPATEQKQFYKTVAE